MIPKEKPKKEFDANGRLIIDGSVLEGGGQILRSSAALSCILGIPIRVTKIRAGREKPGLRPQHLTGLQLIAQICSGNLEGCVIGSTEITLDPGEIGSGQYTADTKTAGSICLLMQAALPCLFYAQHETFLRLKGGTNCDMAPQIDYTCLVFRPAAEKFGTKFDVDIKRRGYYPKGGGEVVVTGKPIACLNAVHDAFMERGDLTRIFHRSFVAGTLPHHLADKVSQSISNRLMKVFPGIKMEHESLKEPDSAAFGSGLGTMIVAETSTGCLFGASALGKPRSRAEETGEAAAKEMTATIQNNGCVDEYLQDQLVLLMTLAKGKSRLRCGPISLHTETAIHVARLMTEVKFEVEESEKETYIISCEGIGHANPFMKGGDS